MHHSHHDCVSVTSPPSDRYAPLRALSVLLCIGVATACSTDADFDTLDQSASSGDEEFATDESGDSEPLDATPLSDDASITADADPAASLSCTYDNDCRASCRCFEGTCSVIPIGPLPPAGHCDAPPTRSCTSGLDCQQGCICSAGTCSAGGPGPWSPTCHLPPPDQYEADNSWLNWSGYAGPQQHSFHYAGDRDWVGVYITSPGLVRFRTHSLTHGADTQLRVYAWDGVTKGALLGSHDDLGGWFFDPNSKSSRIDLEVGAHSAYLIEVVDDSNPSIYTTSLNFPTYTLELSYL